METWTYTQLKLIRGWRWELISVYCILTLSSLVFLVIQARRYGRTGLQSTLYAIESRVHSSVFSALTRKESYSFGVTCVTLCDRAFAVTVAELWHGTRYRPVSPPRRLSLLIPTTSENFSVSPMTASAFRL